MATSSLVTDYARFHQDRVNLTLHILFAPVFVLGVIGAVFSLLTGRWLAGAALALLPAVSLVLQGAGHKRERNPPLPFRGPGDFVKRIAREQFYTFPAFVLGGGFFRAYRS